MKESKLSKHNMFTKIFNKLQPRNRVGGDKSDQL